LTLSPTGNLITDPVGNSVLPATNFDIAIGAPAKRYLAIYAAELQVETLVAQSVIATIGGRILVCPTNLLSVDAASGDTTLHFKYNNLVNGDRIYFEGPDSAGTNSIEFMAVTSGAGGSAGNYTYTVTRNLDGTGANNWPAGSACADTGTTGSGFIDMYSVAGVKSGNGPTIVGNIRNSSTYNDISPRWAIGNLDGLYGYSGTTIGVALGDPAKAWIKLDDTNGVRIGYNTTVNAQIDISGNATFAAGSVTMDANGIRVAVISTQSTLHAYAFTTAFAGTNSVGTFGYEPTSTQRIVTVTNSTGAASKLVQTILSASGASTQATLNIVNDETGTPTPYIETNCVIRPSVNNTAPLGTASLRWSDVQTQLLTANGAATCNSTLNVGGTLAIGSTFFASGLGSSTGTTIVIDGGNFIRVNSSSERFKARIRRWAPTTSLLDVDPIQFDYVGGATDVVGFSAEALWDAGLTHLVNLDADGQPFSLREHALIAHLASIVKHQDARIAALEQR
jgi:hypothetical protein